MLTAVRRCLAIALTFASVSTARDGAAAKQAKVRPVVSREAEVTSVPRERVRRMFLGDVTEWPGGKAVVLVLAPKGSRPMTWLCERLLGMPEEVYRRHLLKRVFEGALSKPLQARDLRQTGELIAETEGALGVLAVKALPERLRALKLR